MTRLLVRLYGPGRLEVTRAHELLAERHRVIPLAVSDFDAATLLDPVGQLGLERFSLLATSSATALALSVAHASPDRVEALVLEAPTPLETYDQLHTLNVPTLVVFGTRDSVTPPESGRVYRAKLPNCHYVLVYDAGHAVAVDRPEAFSSLVDDFLERREAFIVTQKSSLLHP